MNHLKWPNNRQKTNAQIGDSIFALTFLIICSLGGISCGRSKVSSPNVVDSELLSNQNNTPTKTQPIAQPPSAPAEEILTAPLSTSKSPIAQAMRAGDLIRELCLAGEAEEAWQHIDGKFGRVRQVGLSEFFQHAKLPTEELFKLMSQSSYDGEISLCFANFISRFDATELRQFLLGSEYRELNGRFALIKDQELGKQAMGTLSTICYLDPSASDSVVEAASILHKENILEKSQLAYVISESKATDPFRRFNILYELGIDKTTTGFLNDIVESMTDNNPEAAVDLLTSKDDLRTNAFEKSMNQWMEIDPSAAQEWFFNNSKNISDYHRDQASYVFAQAALDHSDRDSAVGWAEEISDVKLQRKILNMIEKGN